jgi:small subunit ribosomal protein S7e
MAFTARTKIVKAKGSTPTQFEETVAQAIFDLETHADFKAELKELHISAAKEVEVSNGKKVALVFVPYRLLPAFHRIQPRLVRELEKKLGKYVVIIGQRRILPKPSRNNRTKAQKRPRSRTLTAVHNALLEDVVYPTEIVGRRIRYRLDGSKVLKVYLDRRGSPEGQKLAVFASVYQKLTGKQVLFENPVE